MNVKFRSYEKRVFRWQTKRRIKIIVARAWPHELSHWQHYNDDLRTLAEDRRHVVIVS